MEMLADDRTSSVAALLISMVKVQTLVPTPIYCTVHSWELASEVHAPVVPLVSVPPVTVALHS